MLQRFVKSAGYNPEKVRVIYHNPRFVDGQRDVDFGIVIVNNPKRRRGSIKDKFDENDYKAACSRQESATIYTVMGVPLEKYKKLAFKLTKFAEFTFGIRIEYVVLDFIVDKEKRVWMIDFVEFKECAEGPRKQLLSGEGFSAKRKAKRKCKCCDEFHLDNAMKNQVALTLVRKACDNMKNRGLSLFSSIEVF